MKEGFEFAAAMALCLLMVIAGIALVVTYIAAIGAAFGLALGAVAGVAVWLFRTLTGL